MTAFYTCSFCAALYQLGDDRDRTEERCPQCETGHLIRKYRLSDEDWRRFEAAP